MEILVKANIYTQVTVWSFLVHDIL